MDRRQSDSQENPARSAKPSVVALAGKCKDKTVDSNEDQIDGRSEVENPGQSSDHSVDEIKSEGVV